jgi:hypothetical protein
MSSSHKIAAANGFSRGSLIVAEAWVLYRAAVVELQRKGWTGQAKAESILFSKMWCLLFDQVLYL